MKTFCVFAECLTACCMGSARVSFMTHKLLIFILGSALKNRKLKPIKDACVFRQDNEENSVNTVSQFSQRDPDGGED